MAFDTRSDGPANNPYAPLMGRTFVSIDETGDITVLDSARIETLSAWVARLIPGNEHWPSAGDLDTVAYIDAVLRLAPELRPVILSGIDAADASARGVWGTHFVSLPAAEQTTILRELESASAREAFGVVLELTYEAYYRAEIVQSIVKDRTGFDINRTVQGAPLERFPTERLTAMGLRPTRYREAS